MYLPRHFEQTDTAQVFALVDAHPLAAWATLQGGEVVVNHVPFLLDRERGAQGTLVGHVARANPVWRDGGPGVFVFQGPDAYVSPQWYASKAEHGKVVPTWNYAVVHAHGTPRIVEDRAALRAIVTRLTDRHEAGRAAPWAVDDAPADYLDGLLGAIVGIEVEVQRWVGKWKVSQNRSAADRAGVAAALHGHAMSGLVAGQGG